MATIVRVDDKWWQVIPEQSAKATAVNPSKCWIRNLADKDAFDAYLESVAL